MENRELLVAATKIIVAAMASEDMRPKSLKYVMASVESVYQELMDMESGVSTGGKRSAVPIGESVQADHLVCLEDGKKLRMMKRYLRTNYNLSPAEYRKKWGLPANYPMVAPDYSEKRSRLAKESGLGRKES